MRKRLKLIKPKNLILSVVAFVLILMITVGATYSWIEDITLFQVDLNNDSENSGPLTAGADINSLIKIEDSGTVNIGNIIKKTYENGTVKSDELQDKVDAEYNEKYVLGNSDFSEQQTVDEKKGYFYESGDMHFSACYGDGKNFYFPVQKNNGESTSNKYRLGNKDDENVNYISVTFQVICETSRADFWFKSLPTIKNHSNNSILSNARYSLTVDGVTNVYSSTGSADTVNNLTSSTHSSVGGVRRTDAYTFDDNANTNNVNTLFSIKKDVASTVTVKIWLEGDTEDVVASDIDLQIISSINKKNTIEFRDYTTGIEATSWLGNDKAKIYLAIPSARREDDIAKHANDEDKKETYVKNESYWQLNKVGDNLYKNDNIPAVYAGEACYIFRTGKDGFGDGNHPNIGGSGIRAYNYWSTIIPQKFGTNTYTVYGSSLDGDAAKVLGEAETFEGNGTWGDVQEVTVSASTYASRDNGNGNLYLIDYTDEKTSGKLNIETMSTTDSGATWKAYIPVDANLIAFSYYRDGKVKYRCAYKTDGAIRPDSVYNYTITGCSYDIGMGSGYWTNHSTDPVYLIDRAGWGGTIKDREWKNIKSGNQFQDQVIGTDRTLSPTSDRVDSKVVYKVSPTASDAAFIRFYKSGTDNKTPDLVLLRNCYYDNSKKLWYKSLEDAQNGESVDSGTASGGGSSSSSGTITTNTPSTEGYYLYGDLLGNGSETAYAKFSSSSVNATVTIPMSANKNYSVYIKRLSGSTWKKYGNGQYYSQTLSNGTSQNDRNLSYNNTQKIQFFPSVNGNLTVTLKSLDNNNGKVSIGWSYSTS